MAGSEIEAEPLAALGRVPLQYVLRETSAFPSSPLPALVYRVALEQAEAELFGGEQGVLVELEAGDAIVIPGGVAHKNEGATPDFAVVGAYPTGTGPDMQYGKPGERPAADRRVQALSLPVADPLQGTAGPLSVLWKSVGSQRGR